MMVAWHEMPGKRPKSDPSRRVRCEELALMLTRLGPRKPLAEWHVEG